MELKNFPQELKKIVCIYHSKDLDGICSGAIVKLKYPNAIMIGYDYKEPLPQFPSFLPVIMVDVSMPIEWMKRVSERSRGEFTWIDHHISAIKDFNDSQYPYIDAVLDTSYSACELTWRHLFPDYATPKTVSLLGIYDTWRQKDEVHDWDKVVLPFQYGMRSIVQGLDISMFPAHTLFQEDWDMPDFFENTIHDGNLILNYQKSQNAIACKTGVFERSFHGIRAICLNTTVSNSQAFEGFYDEEKHDVMIVFRYTGEMWRFSLYTTKSIIDVSVLAKRHGGGGHQKAAGFTAMELQDVFSKD